MNPSNTKSFCNAKAYSSLHQFRAVCRCWPKKNVKEHEEFKAWREPILVPARSRFELDGNGVLIFVDLVPLPKCVQALRDHLN